MKHTPARLMAIALIALGAATVLTTQAQSLNARMDTRPLSPQEIKDYSLIGVQPAGGLNTVGAGQPLYLEVLVNKAINPSNIVSVTWNLATRPVGSAAVLDPSPLGANVPLFRPNEQATLQVAGRKLLRPDIVGQYSVVATVTSTTSTTNLTNSFTASTYLGAPVCSFCHSGGSQNPPIANTYVPWSTTPHATAFTDAINGVSTTHFSKNCISCHAVGYDTNAVNGGFDDIALQHNWMFPTNVSTNNFASMPAALRNLSNVQCENCHGAGSEHATAALFDRELAKKTISVTLSAGDCNQCHDAEPYHLKGQEWANSRHSVATEYPTGENRASCVRCHSGLGFVDFVDGNPQRTAYEAISCAVCHDTHSDVQNPHMLRTVSQVELMDNLTVITNGGNGQLCMNCHMGRRDAVSYVETSSGSSHFGPHYGPQTDMLAGANAITYGKVIPSSAHMAVVEDTCVGCHLQEVAASAPYFGNVGGHTFRPGWDGGTANTTADDVHLTGLCTDCHGDIESFDFKRQDYDGNGIVDGVQTEVKGLLNKVGLLLPPVGSPTVTANSSYTKPQLKALFNYLFVLEDGSFGVHNLSYAVGLLKASIGDLTGDSNMDGVPDAWQIQYFGSGFATNAMAGPNAINNTNGVANWMMATLNLNPSAAFVVDGSGTLFVNGKNIVNGATDTVAIYTAAEVVFDTEIGKTYEIQGISAFPGVWQNIRTNIPGTGGSISYVTPTRDNVQMFFRVIHTP